VFDILIKNGTLYDGAGGRGEKLDIGITGDTIASIGRIEQDQAARVIDATGMAVTPGFIDCHSHSDLTVMVEPLADSKLRQSVTTEIVGNCGTSAAPFHPDILSGFMSEYTDKLASKPLWESFSAWFGLIESQGVLTNGNVRLAVIGTDEGAATHDQPDAMRDLVGRCMDEGVLGLTTGLIYPPGMYADTAELVECAKGLEKANGVYVTHMRSEGDRLIESILETIEIGRRAQVPVHISHLKASGQPNWSKLDRAFEEIERAIDEGVEVTCDRYPYTAGATWLGAVLPDWAQAGGRESILKRLENPGDRARIEEELTQNHETDRWQRVMVVGVKGRVGEDLEGLTVAEIAEIEDVNPPAAIVELLVKTGLSTGALMFSMNEENMRPVIAKPYVMVGSDAWAVRAETAEGHTHPRSYGTFPRVLGRLVRDGVLSLPEAVHKMTGMPAETFHLAKRGLLRESWFADVVVFDPKRVLDLATYAEPHQYAVGIEYVIVNGKIAVEGGKHTGERAGRVLRGTE